VQNTREAGGPVIEPAAPVQAPSIAKRRVPMRMRGGGVWGRLGGDVVGGAPPGDLTEIQSS
jgi:hypothetical protein